MINNTELEVPRKPSELHGYVSDLFARIGTIEIEKHRARLWEGPYKYLIREVYPLSIFCAWRFPKDDVLVKPCIGNQGYDSEIIHQPSGVITRVEISWPIDGRQEKQDARDLNEKGGTDVHSQDYCEGKKLVRARVLKTLLDKAEKDYSDSYLLIVLDLWSAFFMDTERDKADFTAMINDMRKPTIRAKAVYAVLMYPDYVAKFGLPPVIEIKRNE